MNKEIKARWIAALRSGEYRQGRGWLKTEDDSYCCLGVLCELAVQDGIIRPTIKRDDLWWFDGTDTKLLPTPVIRWAELPDNSDVDAVHGGVHNSLAELNDIGEYSFAQIADVIEDSLAHELQAQEDAELEHEATHP